MGVTKFYLIGNTTVPSSWVALIVAFILSYCALRLRFGKKSSDVLVDSIFYFILVWKLSVIVTDFGNVIKSPLSIIYFNGGTIGFYLGLFAVGITLLIESKKNNLHKLDRMALFIGFITIQSAYQVMMALLNKGPIDAQIASVLIFTAFALLIWMSIEKWRASPIQLTVLFPVVHMFAAAFQPTGVLGIPVITTVLVSLFFAMYLMRANKVESEEIE